MAKLDLNALGDPLQDYEIFEPRTKGLWLSLVSLMFVVGGVFIVRQGDQTEDLMGWGTMIFFGLCLIVGLLKLFGKPDTMTLDREGVTYTSLGRPIRTEWSHVSGFGTFTNGPAFVGTKMVGMMMRDTLKTKGTAFANALVGYDGALPTTYGVNAKVLAAALQKRLEAYNARE